MDKVKKKYIKFQKNVEKYKYEEIEKNTHSFNIQFDV